MSQWPSNHLAVLLFWLEELQQLLHGVKGMNTLPMDQQRSKAPLRQIPVPHRF